MERDDARKLSAAEQHERRRQVIRAYKRGRTRMQIAADVGLSYTAVGKIIALFEASGMAALAPRPRGRRAGEDRALTPAQEEAIHRAISGRRPRQFGLAFAQWTRAAVQQLIEREHGVALHVRSVGKYMARWGFKPQGSSGQRGAKPAVESTGNAGVHLRSAAADSQVPAARVLPATQAEA